jgi:hypothetical protein
MWICSMTDDYSPTKCEFCKCYMPRQIEYDEDDDIVGFKTKCTPCTQSEELMAPLYYGSKGTTYE